MKLFGYWRSSASYRVRIALALKGLDYEYAPVNLLKGEQKAPEYLARNPQGLVPALETEDGALLTQSMAIIEYLEETCPEPALLPTDPALRADARAIALTIASEAQPFMNISVQQYLKNDLSLDADGVRKWLNRWPGGAMAAVEKILERTAGDFCMGDTPGFADCFLVPQFFGASRFGVDVSTFTKMSKIYERCQKLPAFQHAHPENQPDAVTG